MERYPTAVSLAILSIEEAGKVAILRGLAMARNGNEVKAAWRSYRSHTKKNVCWIADEYVMNGARRIEDFKGLFSGSADHPGFLDDLKQVGFYTDCLGRAHWSIPEEVINKECASSIIRVAQSKVKNHSYSVKEIELWIQYFKDADRENIQEMKQALSDWHDAMVKSGLSEKQPLMDLFLGK